ncbi:MAG: hypothetical protein RLZZ224_2073 [Verrucomicrobiota bacterium]
MLVQNASIADREQTIARLCECRVVRYHDQSAAIFSNEIEQELHDGRAVVGVEIACWFIGKKQVRLMDDGSCNRDALLLTARKLGGEVIAAFAESDTFQRSHGSDAVVMPTDSARYHDIFQRRKFGQEMIILKNVANALIAKASLRCARQGVEVRAINDYLSLLWPFQAGEGVQ